jgi:uncharacterized membrane protein
VLRKYLAREIEQWSKNGLLQPGQGDILLADHDRRHTGFSLSGVLAVLAAVLFGAAVIALVAANWEFIARPVRVLMIGGLILTGLGATVIAQRRGALWISEAALVFTLLCYGAGIALIGQMYHLSGDDADFMLMWTFGAVVAGLCFSSPMAAIGAGFLGLSYFFAELAAHDFETRNSIGAGVYLGVLAVALATGFTAWRARSGIAAHLTVILVIGWVLWITHTAFGIESEYMMIGAGGLAFAVGSFPPAGFGALVERHGAVSAYGSILLLSGLAILQAELSDPSFALEIVVAALILLASIAVLAVAGRENRFIRRFAYFAFAAETLYVVGETLGSLLGSSGFLFLGGLALALIAYVVMKIERRLGAGREPS